jgi:hypothetical protein
LRTLAEPDAQKGGHDMKAVKLGGLVVGLAVVAVVLYQALVFGRQAGDVLLATLRSGQRTAEYNEQIAAGLAGAGLADRLVALAGGLESVLRETTETMQAARPALAEAAATTRTARVAIAEAAQAAKAARVAIEGASLPDVNGLLRQTGALVEQTTTLVHDADASTRPLLATSQRLLDQVDHLVADSELTGTLRTTGRLLANIEHDQGNVSTLLGNTVAVSEVVKREAVVAEQDLAKIRERLAHRHWLFRLITTVF